MTRKELLIAKAKNEATLAEHRETCADCSTGLRCFLGGYLAKLCTMRVLNNPYNKSLYEHQVQAMSSFPRPEMRVMDAVSPNTSEIGSVAAPLKRITVTATGTAVPAINGVATVQGAQATISAGDVRASSFSRNQINQFCRTKYTRAVAWCLHIFDDDPRMSVQEICKWLDEIGVESPKKNISWERCWDDNKPPWNRAELEKMVSRQRKFVQDKLGKVNQ